MSRIENLSLRRREFLGWSAAGALVLGFGLPVRTPAGAAAGPGGGINAFIAVDRDGGVTFQNPFIEMGQGTYTALPMMIAEELDVELGAIRVEQAPHGDDYKIMFNSTIRFTGGSASVRTGFEPICRAGASARAMLMSAAAKQWRVPDAELTTEPGYVVHAASGRRLSYGELAPAAATLPPPENVALKDPSRYRVLGKPTARTDAVEKSSGRAVFGIDVQEPDMLTAAVRHAPVFGAKVKKLDAGAVKQMPGVVAVEDLGGAVAVLADNYWHARKAADALAVTFSDAPAPDFSAAGHLEKLRSRLDDEGYAAENEGDVRAAFAGAASVIEAEYHVPFLSHATLEPQNCSALVKDGRCTVWAPNQGADFVAMAAAEITQLPLDTIDVHTPYLGGGFGRRFILDYVRQAVTLAKRHKGRTVKVVWSREEDTQHDFYRPLIAAKYRAAFDAPGKPVALHATTVGDGPGRQTGFSSDPNLDGSVMEGAFGQPYAIANRRSDYVLEESPVPLGFWRSVGHSQNGFIKESFIDEMAHAAAQDPVEFRRSLLSDAPRFRKVLDTAVSMAKWRGGKWQSTGGRMHAMGVALHESFGSIVAEVAEVSLNDAGRPQVHRVWCAVDCGFAVNPLVLVHQVESAVAYGLSAALHEEITVEKGRVENANFDTYPILAPREMPAVEVEIINSGAEMGGIGEVGTPPIAPAVCNALFTLTGKRIRSLPLARHKFT